MTLEQLKAAGFKSAIIWEHPGAEIVETGDGVPDEPGLYLFVVGAEMRYVGAALDSLRSRMRSYQGRQKRSALSRPVHVSLDNTLRLGQQIEVYVRPITKTARIPWEGLPVDVILGIEAALILDIKPKWNRRGRPSA